MNFIIESGIPAPKRGELMKELREAMTALKPDQCFTVLVNKTRPLDIVVGDYHALKREFKSRGRAFTSSKVKLESGAPAFRIWEVKPPPKT
jgi:hypothetical protein